MVDDVARDEFEEKYPEYRDQLIPQGGTQGPVITGGWLDEDHVRVAEYFRIVERDDVLHRLPDGSTMREAELQGEMLVVRVLRSPWLVPDGPGRHSVRIVRAVLFSYTSKMRCPLLRQRYDVVIFAGPTSEWCAEAAAGPDYKKILKKVTWS